MQRDTQLTKVRGHSEHNVQGSARPCAGRGAAQKGEMRRKACRKGEKAMAALACVTEKISLKACVRRSRPCLLCLLGVAWLAGSASPLLASPEPLPLSRSESQGHADALEAMLTRAELLEETKRVRKLEVEILELEERARRQKTQKIFKYKMKKSVRSFRKHRSRDRCLPKSATCFPG